MNKRQTFHEELLNVLVRKTIWSILERELFRRKSMIFLVVGVALTTIGIFFRLFPSKGNLPLYGYHSPLAAKTDELWQLAQKVSGKYFIIFGLIMAAIGYLLKVTGNTNYFLIEMLVLVFPIMPIFILTEKKLQKFDQKSGGDDYEHFND